MPGTYRSRYRRYRYRPRSYRRKYSARIGRRPYYRKYSRRNYRSKIRMSRARMPRISTANYIGDTVLVRFRNESQVNSKQLAASFGTALLVPGNFLPDVDIPTLSVYTARYNWARVTRSTIKVTFTNIEATYSKDVGVTQMPANDASPITPSATVYFSEQPRTKSSYLSPLAGSKSTATIMCSSNNIANEGSTIIKTSGQDIMPTTAMTGGPITKWYWNVWTQNVSGAGTLETAGTNMRIITYYTIQFYERKDVTV